MRTERVCVLTLLWLISVQVKWGEHQLSSVFNTDEEEEEKLKEEETKVKKDHLSPLSCSYSNKKVKVCLRKCSSFD